MVANQDVGRSLPVRAFIEAAELIAATFSSGSSSSSLNAVEHKGIASISALPLVEIQSLIDGGHLVEIRVRSGDWRLYLRRGGTDGDATEEDGPTSAAIDQSQVDDLDRAIAAKDFQLIVGMLEMHEAEVRLRVINNPDLSGTHWLANHKALPEALSSQWWMPLARQLSAGPTGLLVDDLGDSVLKNQALTIYGPVASSSAVGDIGADRREPVVDQDMLFRQSQSGSGDPNPSPLLFNGIRQTSGTAAAAVSAATSVCNRLAFLLTWKLLGSVSEPIEGGVAVTIHGARELNMDILPGDDPDTGVLVELYRWVASSSEIDRLYFVQQALTLAVVVPTDALTAAEPALRTAKSLYDLSRRSSVAEVMSARRSAREIALSAGRSAATQARDSAAKSVERTVVQVAAGAGVVVASLQKVVSSAQAIGLLALIVALCVASAIVTDFVALHSARRGLSEELDDLDRYRDSLSADDVSSIKGVGAVQAAKGDLARARFTVWCVYGLTTVALVVAIVCLRDRSVSDNHESGPSPSAPTSTLSPSAPAP